MDLFAFDCDGTLSVSGGPIDVGLLTGLVAKGHKVVIVSPSGACKPLGFEHVDSGLTRDLNLMRVKEMHQGYGRYIYVGDAEADKIAAQNSSYEFVWANEFNAFVLGYFL
jgi:hypothetical protein